MAIKRELAVAYGSWTSNDTTRMLDGQIVLRRSYLASEAEFTVVLAPGSGSLLASEVATLEAAFSLPYRNFRITQGGSVLLDWKHGGGKNTGFNAIPEAVKEGHVTDTGQSRRYRCRVRVEHAALGAPTEGLAESSVALDTDASKRRIITIEGRFTAVRANDARAQYDARIDAFQQSAIDDVGGGGTYELIAEQAQHDTTDKSLFFRRELLEVLSNQSDSGLDDPDLNDHSFSVTVERVNPGDTPDARRLVRVVGTYDVAVDQTATTNLRNKYEQSIRSFIINEMKSAVADGGSFALVRESPVFDQAQNRISATLEMLAATSGQTTLSKRVTVSDQLRHPRVLVPVMDGTPWARYEYFGPGELVRVASVVALIEEDLDAEAAARRADDFLADVSNRNASVFLPDDVEGGGGWREVGRKTDSTRVTIGDETEGDSFQATEITGTITLEYTNVVRSRTSSFGGKSGGSTGGAGAAAAGSGVGARGGGQG